MERSFRARFVRPAACVLLASVVAAPGALPAADSGSKEEPVPAAPSAGPREPDGASEAHGHFPAVFGPGLPRAMDELPDSVLKRDLVALPAPVRGAALGRLQALNFPREDAHALRLDRQGHPYYEDVLEGALSAPSDSVGAAKELSIERDKVFQLHSRPGAGSVLYLDFDGGALHPDSAWNPSSGGAYVLQPFDPAANDPDFTTPDFTDAELSLIHEIWHRIAEDFARFDIDVTTEEPAVFSPTTGTVAFTYHEDALGRNLPGSNGGGIAYTGKFGLADYPTRWSPALVYYSHLSSAAPGNPAHTAELGAHEFAHNLGLGHDGTSSTTYYGGHGSGNTSWAPIMGAPFDRNVTTWSRGEYAGANNSEDDLAIMAGHLGYASDDHGDTLATATPLAIDANGDILVSTPQEDPDNVLSENKGVIDSEEDSDWFGFSLAGSGQLSLVATPAWQAFRRDGARGANLDIALSLVDAAGTLLAVSDPLDDTAAIQDLSLPAGDYFIGVTGTGTDAADGYTAYASQGMYFLEGYVLLDGAASDTQAPSPGTMAFDEAPTALDATRIRMSAVTATDASGVVEYAFTCTVGDAACADRGWSQDRNFELGGLTPETYYAFTVRARDKYGNENQASPSIGATTLPLPANQPPQAVARYEEFTAVIQKGNHADVQMLGSDSSDPDGVIATWTWTDASGNVLSNLSGFVQRLSKGTHQLTLTVTDDGGLSASDTVSVTVAKAGDDGAGGGGNGGGDDKCTGPCKKPPKG